MFTRMLRVTLRTAIACSTPASTPVTLAIRPAHSALLASIRHAPGSPRVVVIGAVAVGHHIPLARETGDVDLATVAEETEVKAILTAANWVREKNAKQR